MWFFPLFSDLIGHNSTIIHPVSMILGNNNFGSLNAFTLTPKAYPLFALDASCDKKYIFIPHSRAFRN